MPAFTSMIEERLSPQKSWDTTSSSVRPKMPLQCEQTQTRRIVTSLESKVMDIRDICQEHCAAFGFENGKEVPPQRVVFVVHDSVALGGGAHAQQADSWISY
ncbi:hypothetical protein Esti_004161 [Eimeria stiedai]